MSDPNIRQVIYEECRRALEDHEAAKVEAAEKAQADALKQKETDALLAKNIDALGTWVVDHTTKADLWPRLDLYAELRESAEQTARKAAEAGRTITDCRFIVKTEPSNLGVHCSYGWKLFIGIEQFGDSREFYIS